MMPRRNCQALRLSQMLVKPAANRIEVFRIVAVQLVGWVELLRNPSNFILAVVEQEGLDTALVVCAMGFARVQPILRAKSLKLRMLSPAISHERQKDIGPLG